MNRFVLDNSVAMRWILATPKLNDQQYSENVLLSLVDNEAQVPNLWYLEASNVLFNAEKRGDLCASEVESFIARIEQLPIQVDSSTYQYAFNGILALSKKFSLGSYDAAYLELAIREKLPIASLDKDLQKAARKSGVKIYLHP